MVTVGELLLEGASAFREAAFGDSDHEAIYLLGARLNAKPSQLTLRRNDGLSDQEAAGFRADVARRLKREPADYIVGWKEFCGRRFAVDSRALIPRPETEEVAGRIIDSARARKGRQRILDVGTGTGCLAVTMALELPGAEVSAVDLSAGALSLARANAAGLNASAIHFVLSDLFGSLPPENQGYFDIIASNPPYVPTGSIRHLESELAHEPEMALDGGPDGLSVVGRLIAESPAFLAAGGELWMEIGFDQGARVAAALSKKGFSDVRVFKDLEGNDRIARGVFIGPV